MTVPNNSFQIGQRVWIRTRGATGTIRVTHPLLPGYYDVQLDNTPTRRVVFETELEAVAEATPAH
jgi:hypothetical protein